MHTPPSPPTSAAARLLSALVLLVPAAVAGLAAAKAGAGPIAGGAGLVAVVGLYLARKPVPAWQVPSCGGTALVYLAAVVLLSIAAPTAADPLTRAARGSLLFVAAGLFASFDLGRSGLGPRRRAVALCRRLTARAMWPSHPAEYADLAEVRALPDAIRDDPGPALDLLTNPRPEVRTAALVALQARPYWRPSEAAVVAAAGRAAPEPVVRAAAVAALGRAGDPVSIATVARFLRDPVGDVRATAVVALLADPARWPAVREYMRDALAAPAFAADGPLPGAAGRLPPLAVCDLTAWATEPEPLAGRAVKTLVEHYAAKLRTGLYPELPAELGRMVTDAQSPTPLRVELAGLLRGLDLIPPELLDRMTDADQPGPVRLLAAEVFLTLDPQNAEAVDVLRGLGRQPNRETAVTIARLLQTYLGMDMGLPPGAVEPNSRAAADAAKRVLAWATNRSAPAPAVPPPRPPSVPGRKPAPPPAARSGSKASLWGPG
jgi:hypothetical protein